MTRYLKLFIGMVLLIVLESKAQISPDAPSLEIFMHTENTDGATVEF